MIQRTPFETELLDVLAEIDDIAKIDADDGDLALDALSLIRGLTAQYVLPTN